MDLWQGFLALAIIFTCGLLIIVILLQRGRGGGLVGAFGGAGGTSAFGAKTGDVFTWITVVVAAIFFLLAIAGNFVFDQSPRPAALPAEVSPTVPTGDAGGTQVPGLPVKIEPVSVDTPSGTATPPPIKVDVRQEPPAAPAPAPGSGETKPVPPADEAKPQPAPGSESAEPKKPEEAPKSGEDKPAP